MKAIRDIFIVFILLIVAGAVYSLFRPAPAPIAPVWNATTTPGKGAEMGDDAMLIADPDRAE